MLLRASGDKECWRKLSQNLLYLVSASTMVARKGGRSPSNSKQCVSQYTTPPTLLRQHYLPGLLLRRGRGAQVLDRMGFQWLSTVAVVVVVVPFQVW